MKKNNKIAMRMLTAILLSAVAVACGKETSPTEPQQVPKVSFTTRGTLNTDIWQVGDQVKLSVIHGDSRTYQYDGTSGWVASDDVPLLVEFPITLSAWFPSSANNTSFTMPAILSDSDADQSDAVKLHAADYMTSDEITFSTPNVPINLTLEHRMCKVTVRIESYDAAFSTIPTVTNAKVVSKSRSIQRAEDSWTAQDRGVNVLPLIQPDNTNGLHTYSAIVSPGTYATGDKLMTLTVDGKELSVPLTAVTTFTSGNVYAFTLKVHKNIDPTLTTASYPGGWNTETDL